MAPPNLSFMNGSIFFRANIVLNIPSYLIWERKKESNSFKHVKTAAANKLTVIFK